MKKFTERTHKVNVYEHLLKTVNKNIWTSMYVLILFTILIASTLILNSVMNKLRSDTVIFLLHLHFERHETLASLKVYSKT